jgi:hypothetical protein
LYGVRPPDAKRFWKLMDTESGVNQIVRIQTCWSAR